MAPKKNKGGLDKQERKILTGILHQYGLHGDYLALIDAAVRNGWEIDQFFHRVTRTPAFQAQFPGLMERNGTLSNLLAGGEGVNVTAANLKKAVTAYGQLWGSYQHTANQFGYGKVTKKMLGEQIKQEVSPQEFADRLVAIQTIEANPEIETAMNAYLKSQGRPPMDKHGLAGALASKQSQFINDYEAARISAGGTGVTGQEALGFAQHNLQPGQKIDLGQLVSQVRETLGTINSEMGQQGISNSDLLKFVADPNANPDLAGKINQILQTRKSLGGSYVPGYQNKKGAGGGPTQYDQGGQAAYG